MYAYQNNIDDISIMTSLFKNRLKYVRYILFVGTYIRNMH